MKIASSSLSKLIPNLRSARNQLLSSVPHRTLSARPSIRTAAATPAVSSMTDMSNSYAQKLVDVRRIPKLKRISQGTLACSPTHSFPAGTFLSFLILCLFPTYDTQSPPPTPSSTLSNHLIVMFSFFPPVLYSFSSSSTSPGPPSTPSPRPSVAYPPPASRSWTSVRPGRRPSAPEVGTFSRATNRLSSPLPWAKKPSSAPAST